MAYLDDLKTTRDQIAARLKDITAAPKPSYSIDGQTIQWNDYFRALTEQLKNIEMAINTAEPYEVQSRGYTV